MKTWINKCLALVLLLVLAGCVTVEPPKPVIVSGVATYNENLMLPNHCKITIAVIDLKTPGSILGKKTYDVARVPVQFKFFFPANVIDEDADYAVVASIDYQGTAIFQTYDKYRVISNGKTTAGVVMKAVPIK